VQDETSRPIVIRNGRVIDPAQGLDAIADVVIEDGRIRGIAVRGRAEAGRPEGALELDASGLVVCPGFIDLHAHLREPGFEYKETIATGTRAAAAGGFTTVCCMANTNPPIDTRATVEYVLRTAAEQGVIRVLPVAAITRGLAGRELTEMADLADAGAVGFSDDGKPVVSGQVMRRAMEYASMLGRPVMPHLEDPGLAEGGVMNEGPVATRLGLKGIPAEAEEVELYRDLALARLTGCHLHVLHVSTAGSVELIRRAKERGIRVTAEATPHHLTLTDELVAGQWRSAAWRLDPYDTSTKVNPPLRSSADVRAVLEGLKDGTIDCIATDHAPHADVDKNVDYESAAFGISGFETALGVLLGLVHDGELTLPFLIERLTVRPAQVLNLPYGRLTVGSTADVTLFDPEREWDVDPQRFFSKGKNTPLAGATLRGKVQLTFFGGRPVHACERFQAVLHLNTGWVSRD
jgi:dihydroorotase